MIELTACEIVYSTEQAHLELRDDDIERMTGSRSCLDRALEAGEPVYGLTRGFGPLVSYSADKDGTAQGTNLILHLAAGQGEPLPPNTTRLMLRLRLEGMKLGFSGISPADWQCLADAYNAGFTPVVPSKGSVSASGDLVPLAHAALALAGDGEAWVEVDGHHRKERASTVLKRLGVEPITWSARDALAFVNGSSASLAVTLQNHVELLEQSWVSSAVTGRLINLLGCCTEPYAPTVVAARGGSLGHARASQWIRAQVSNEMPASKARSLQEPYSLRCAAQIIGAVLDQLWSSEPHLVKEARGCSDNPVVSTDGVFHAGNFHAITSGIVSDLHVILAHQLAFLAERQLAVVVEPSLNGGLPALLAPNPGATSGLAGVQIAASAMVAEMRLKATPATTTALPTNLTNQDIVPMSLASALRTAGTLELGSLVLSSLAVAIAQVDQLQGSNPGDDMWARIADDCPRLESDRSLSSDVRAVRNTLFVASRQLHKDPRTAGACAD